MIEYEPGNGTSRSGVVDSILGVMDSIWGVIDSSLGVGSRDFGDDFGFGDVDDDSFGVLDLGRGVVNLSSGMADSYSGVELFDLEARWISSPNRDSVAGVTTCDAIDTGEKEICRGVPRPGSLNRTDF